MNTDVLSFIIGVLEDYSNRYVFFGAIFVACLFGMYSILGIGEFKKNKILSQIIFVILFFSGLISLTLTFEYSLLTTTITRYILESDLMFVSEWNKMFNIQNPLSPLNNFIYKNMFAVFLVIYLIYFGITFIPFDIIYNWGFISRLSSLFKLKKNNKKTNELQEKRD